MMRHANAVGIGNCNRTRESSAFIDPQQTGHLAIPVERKSSSPNRLECPVFATRMNHRNTGSHRPLSDDKIPITLDQGGKTNLYPGNVSNGIERARLKLGPKE